MTLQELLADWLPDQRWFAGKGRAIDEVVVESGAGEAASFTDEVFAEAGASIGDALAADPGDGRFAAVLLA